MKEEEIKIDGKIRKIPIKLSDNSFDDNNTMILDLDNTIDLSQVNEEIENDMSR